MGSLRLILTRSVDTLKPMRPQAEWVSKCQLTEWGSVSKNPFKMGFCFYTTGTQHASPHHEVATDVKQMPFGPLLLSLLYNKITKTTLLYSQASALVLTIFYLGKELMLDRWMSQLIGYLPRKDIMSGQCDAAKFKTRENAQKLESKSWMFLRLSHGSPYCHG